MHPGDFLFQPLDPSRIQTLVQWAAREGWEPGLADAQSFAAAFPDAFYGFFLDGELAAGGALANYGGLYGFMGFFIVRPDLRGQGLGRALWFKRRDTLLTKIRPGASIGMDGVAAMQPFYQKGGFQVAYRDERRVRQGEFFPANPAVSTLTPADFDELAAFDLPCFGFPRPRLLARWVFEAQARTFCHRTGGQLDGYTTLRRTASGHRIGPLFAATAQAARALYQSCLAAVPGEQVFLDVPMRNPQAIQLADEFNARYTFECARMYYGPEPAHRLDRVYGLTTFEVG